MRSGGSITARFATDENAPRRTQRRPGGRPGQARLGERPGVLAEPRRGRRDRSVPAVRPARVPRAGHRAVRPRQPPRLPQGHGGLARPGRGVRVCHPDAREDRPVGQGPRERRSPAGPSSSPRRWTWAAWPPASWSKATPAGRPRSRATPTTRPASARPTCSCRPPPCRCMTRTGRKVSMHLGQVVTWDDFLGTLTNEMEPAPGQEGRRAPDPDRGRRVAQPGRPDQGVPRGLPRGEVAPLRAGRTGTTPRRGQARLRRVVDPVYHLDKADVILALDADFLACGAPGRVCDERAFAARREPKAGVMNRLYVVEAAYTSTGASADHRLADPGEPDRRASPSGSPRSWASRGRPPPPA